MTELQKQVNLFSGSVKIAVNISQKIFARKTRILLLRSCLFLILCYLKNKKEKK